jgi:hypothetical protein
MSISEKIAKALNRGGPSVNHMFFKGKLGSFLSTLEQTATSLTSRIVSAEGNISTLQQTATSLTSQIADVEGDMKNIASGFAKHTHICYTLKAADVSGGKATIELDGEYDSVSGILVLSDAGAPRAITKVEITEDTEEGTFALEVTATSVAAGDTIHADLYLMA